jgi:molybdopterin-guanine dinucleotide biosynthesis protein
LSTEISRVLAALRSSALDTAPVVRRVRTARNAFARARKPRKRFLKHWAWENIDVRKNILEQSDVFLGASDVSDYVAGRIAMARDARNIGMEHQRTTVLCDKHRWYLKISEFGLRVTKFSDSRGFVIADEDLSYLCYEINSASIIVDVYGDIDFVDRMVTWLNNEFEIVTNVIEWIYSNDGQSVEVPLRNDRIPLSEMYPWLGDESLDNYYDRFMESEASILLLIGPPGTGKTTFIRGLLHRAQESAIVTYDATILAKDFVFAQFIEGDRNIMVIEDADEFLGARTEGNGLMHKFLNVGDGLVTTKNKKMIFSTNLPSIRDIDAALTRPGRCFDIVHFDLLNYQQAQSLAEKLKVDIEKNDTGKYSIADIFHKQTEAPKHKSRSMGFL